MNTRKFHEVFADEVAAINRRRNRHERRPIGLEQEGATRDGTPILRPTPESDLVGLACSGGGIRSSAFCLGVLQALDDRGLIGRVDYLSTVSGGGYIGLSMTAAMSQGTVEKFPFASKLRPGEEPGVQHIRDHSNYLFPQGALNIFGNVVVYLRGLVANALLLSPWLLLAAAFTIWSNPNQNALTETKFASIMLPHLPIDPSFFGLTLNLLALFAILLALWALWRSTPTGRDVSDIGWIVRMFALLAVVILGVAFCEFQPFVLSGMFGITDPAGHAGFATVSDWIQRLAGVLATIGTVVGFLGRFLADALKRNTEKPGFTAFATRIAIKLAMLLAGAAVPLALWVAYLYLSYWGIQKCAGAACHADPPGWIATLAGLIPFAGGSVLAFYASAGLALLVVSSLLNDNANSLHRLYRDRLSKAFLFNPHARVPPRTFWQPGGGSGGWGGGGGGGGSGATAAGAARPDWDLQPLDKFKVSKLDTELAPYHLINTALNIEASKHANRRGRNAEFFIFSPHYTGSAATGYVETAKMEDARSGLTVGCAMAISGAAASSNMGSATIKALVPTLAILNIRLGYWLPNPKRIAGELKRNLLKTFFNKLYFLNELLGQLTETSDKVYLTDGGHIENLGIYELLRRRCRLIVAIDAEADPDMTFGSLVELERYARIDFGIRLDLPWAAVRDATHHASRVIGATGGLATGGSATGDANGPHCALGTIYYPRKQADGTAPPEDESAHTGVLLYVKASLTGDENDYVVDYKRRNASFPHETTLDQLFSEEQFEAYRALGFHALHAAFKGDDKVSMRPGPARWQGAATSHPLERRMRDILGQVP